jgi:hypothetical protein
MISTKGISFWESEGSMDGDGAVVGRSASSARDTGSLAIRARKKIRRISRI